MKLILKIHFIYEYYYLYNVYYKTTIPFIEPQNIIQRVINRKIISEVFHVCFFVLSLQNLVDVLYLEHASIQPGHIPVAGSLLRPVADELQGGGSS